MLRYCRFTSYCQKYYRNIPALFSLFPPWQHLKKIQYIITMAPLATVKTQSIHLHKGPPSCPCCRTHYSSLFPTPSFTLGNRSCLLRFSKFLMSKTLNYWNHLECGLLGIGFFFTQHNSSKMLCISIAALLFFYHWYGWTTVCNHFTCWETSVLVPDLG